MWPSLLEQVQKGEIRAIARTISFIENEQPGYQQLLQALPHYPDSKIIGVTGPPGAGKSTLVDGLIRELVLQGYKVGVLCVDPSSPFNLGAVLGDRIRMSDWYTHPQVYIRSLATRGSMGGLHPKIIEIADLLKAAAFDYIIVETVGVGQSEIEIAGLADTTVVVVVPEAGDEVQTMKAGLMEIADIFVVNKSDRPDADVFVKNLRLMLAPAFASHKQEIPIIKTIAHQNSGLTNLVGAIQQHLQLASYNEKKSWLLTEKAYQLIQKERMRDIDKTHLLAMLVHEMKDTHFNLYKFAQQFINLNKPR
jgi:LAO/AO transport system kinase